LLRIFYLFIHLIANVAIGATNYTTGTSNFKELQFYKPIQ